MCGGTAVGISPKFNLGIYVFTSDTIHENVEGEEKNGNSQYVQDDDLIVWLFVKKRTKEREEGIYNTHSSFSETADDPDACLVGQTYPLVGCTFCPVPGHAETSPAVSPNQTLKRKNKKKTL
jgi:hypothetical protein